jgi:uncharacterized membrane protein YidH (DUF202 family)
VYDLNVLDGGVDIADRPHRPELLPTASFPSVGAIRRAGIPKGTPRRLNVLSAAAAVVLVLVAALAALVTQRRWEAVHEIRRQTAPLTEAARQIHASLADADEVVARSMVTAVETQGERDRFAADISSAQRTILDASYASGFEFTLSTCPDPSSDYRPGDASRALSTLSCAVPVYTELIGEARANNRLGYPVGAAYVRRATGLVQNVILPAADDLAQLSAARHDAAYHRATDRGLLALELGAALLALVVLALVMVALFRWTNRRLSVPLLAAVLLLALTVGYQLEGLHLQQRRLVAARDDGYLPLSRLTYLRQLALRADTDVMHWRIAQGGVIGFDNDFIRTADSILRLLRDPAAAADAGPAMADRAGTALQDGNRALRSADPDAIIAATGEFTDLDTAISDAVARRQAVFGEQVRSADGVLRWLVPAPAVLLLAAALGWLGPFLRMRDYRQ